MRVYSRRSLIVAHDLLMVSLAWALAFYTRYNFTIDGVVLVALKNTLPIVLPIQGIVLWWGGLYRSLWRFASIPDLWNIVRAVTVGIFLIIAGLFLLSRLEGIPRSNLVSYPFILIVLLGAPRLIYRIWKDQGVNVRRFSGRKSVLVIGAGRAGEMLARDMKRDGNYVAVGFLDDNPQLRRVRIQGVPVLGTIESLESVLNKMAVDVILIAMPSASSAEMQRVVELCERVSVPFRTLPKLHDVVTGQSSLRALREVKIEDLLGREPISLDWRNISEGLEGKTVLVSGGGGSIGSELCRQIAQLGPARIVLFERTEFNLYSIEMELLRDHPELELSCFLGDVSDRGAVEHVLSQHHPDIIFHAAAYKHVPILQMHPRQAVRNNVVGTKTLAEAADKYGVGTFVMISTDKAVRPANVMGATKRVAEVFCQGLNQRSATRFITVRFGNVLGSAGSVVPLFQKQIETGGPVTVTHPEITRYFMTIPEACQLIMQASVMGKGGEIFVLDMGKPVKITYLAEQMIRLAGKVPGKDIEIRFTGLRPGEKLFEELFYDEELLTKTPHEKILLAHPEAVEWNRLRQGVADLEAASEAFDEVEILRVLHQLVPEMCDESIEEASNVVEFKRAKA